MRIATLIRERNAAGETTVLGLATGSTPIGVYRELIRMHRDEGSELRRRRDVQSRRVLPDAEGQHPLLPSLHVGESVLADRHQARERAHPAGRRAAHGRRRGGAALRDGDRARRRHRLPDSRHRQDGPHRIQRARLRRRQPHAPRHARRGHAPRRRRRFLRRGVRAARSDHDGRRDDSRRARDRDHRHRRAQGEHRAARRRRRHRRRSRGDVPPAASEHDVLRRPRRRRRAHAHQDAVAASTKCSGRRTSSCAP